MTGTATRRPLSMHPRIGRRRAQVARDRGRRRLRAAVAGCVVFGIGAGALLLLHSPFLSARHVTVEGADHTALSLVVRTAGLQGHPPLIDVSSGAASRRLEALPWVGRAVVRRRWPDSVTVEITERQPVAVTAAEAPATWALIDATGRVLQWQATRPAGLPLLVSPVRAGPAGSRIGPAAVPGLAVVQAAQSALDEAVVQVTVGTSGMVTMLLPGSVEAVMGQSDALGPKMAALRSVLAGAPPAGPETIDVTVPGEPTVGPPEAPPSTA